MYLKNSCNFREHAYLTFIMFRTRFLIEKQLIIPTEIKMRFWEMVIGSVHHTFK